MAKKKSQARQKKRAQSRQQRRGAQRTVDHQRESAESQKAIKTLIIGAIAIATISAFFAFKWDGQSAYDRLIGEGDSSAESAAR